MNGVPGKENKADRLRRSAFCLQGGRAMPLRRSLPGQRRLSSLTIGSLDYRGLRRNDEGWDLRAMLVGRLPVPFSFRRSCCGLVDTLPGCGVHPFDCSAQSLYLERQVGAGGVERRAWPLHLPTFELAGDEFGGDLVDLVVGFGEAWKLALWP